jgi:hypothetical protein
MANVLETPNLKFHFLNNSEILVACLRLEIQGILNPETDGYRRAEL